MINPLDAQIVTWEAAGKSDFSVYEVARAQGVPTWQASGWIQDYNRRQRNKSIVKRPTHVIARVEGTRTRGARWHIGSDPASSSNAIHGMGNDLMRGYIRRTRKDILAMADLDPLTKAKLNASITALDLQFQAFEAALKSF